MRSIFLALLIYLAMHSVAFAAEWPTSWLGPADNYYRVLNIGVFYHALVLHDMPDASGNPTLPGSSQQWLRELSTRAEFSAAEMEAEFERVKAELEDNRDFYWRNTRFNLALNFDWNVDYIPRLHSSISNHEAPWHSPVDFPFYGKARQRYDGCLQIMVMYTYDEASGKLQRVSGGGGWTSGASDDQELCGWSWWAATTASNVCGNQWLLCHEFGHQVDSLFARSGHPEHWFNHLAQREGNLARFGEHFDCMSYILRRTPESDWLDLAWGELCEYADADADHVPDPDQYLSVLGLSTDPDPTARDTDGDGLPDYWEFMTNHGARSGHGQILHPALSFTDPKNPDSDGDSLPDGADPLPWLPMPAFIPSWGLPHWSDSELPVSSGDFSVLALTSEFPDLNVILAIRVERDTALEFTIAWGAENTQNPSELQLMLDLDNDGWFTGDDNYRLILDATGFISLTNNKAVSYSIGPVESKLELDHILLDLTWIEPAAGYAYAAKFQVNCTKFPALAAKPGEELGLGFGIRLAGDPWYYTIQDPNSLVPLTIR